MFIFVGCLLNEPLTSLEQNAKLEDKQQPADGRRFIWQQTTASISAGFVKKSVFVVPFLSLTEESATVESLMLGGGHVLQHSTTKKFCSHDPDRSWFNGFTLKTFNI